MSNLLAESRGEPVRHGVCLALFAGAWLYAAGAEAQPDRDARREARAAFVRAVELFDGGQHAESLVLFERAWTLSQQPLVLLNIAAAREAMGRHVEALDALERFEREAPPRVLRAQRTTLEAALVRARARVATLRVRGGPEAMTVSVDAREQTREVLAQGLRLVAGDHRVGVTAPGFRARDERLTLEGGVTREVDATLQPAEGTLRVDVSVAGARVAVDERDVGTTPLPGPLTLTDGSHRVRVTEASHRQAEEAVTIGAEPTTLSITLSRVEAPQTPSAPLPTVAPARSSGAGWWVVGGGAAVAVGGGVALGLAMSAWVGHTRAQDALEPAALANQPGARVGYNAHADLIAADHRYLAVSIAALAVGVVVAATGAVVVSRAGRRARAPRMTWTSEGVGLRF